MNKKNTLLFTIALFLLTSFGYNAQTLNEILKATASDTNSADRYGFSVDIDDLNGNRAVIGTPFNDNNNLNSNGAVYVMKFNNNTNLWEEEAKLVASDTGASDQFGTKVAISGSNIIVGAWGNDDRGTNSGAAYIFSLTNGVWAEQAKLVPADGNITDRFGDAVDIYGNKAIIGAWWDDDNGNESGSAYIYSRDQNSWSLEQKLTAPDGSGADYFGSAVAIDFNRVIVGAYGNDDNGSSSGSAYVYRYTFINSYVWQIEEKLTANDADAGDFFGRDVDITSYPRVIIGAPGKDDNGSNSGAAYIFKLINGTWVQEQKIIASNADRINQFGNSVSIRNTNVAVGAHGNNNGTGAAYAFQYDGNTWSENRILLASDGGNFDDFGFSVSVRNNIVLAGAPRDDNANGIDSGAAYFFDTTAPTDTTPPVITIAGNARETIEVGNTYTDAGATANDDTDGNISNNINDVSTVDINTVGSYTVTYTVSDAAGNAATPITRTVNVVDTTKPVITLVGANPQIIEVGSAYTELTATANDNYDGDISGDIVIDASNVDVNLVGSYSVTYNVDDANSNSATPVTRTVNVVDTTKPVITLVGANPQIIKVGSAYTELTATANDNYDGDISGDIVIDATNVDVNLVGSYSVTYNVDDANSNSATLVTRTVNVVDTTIPVITLVGANSQIIEVGSAYTELTATANDNYDGDISGNIVIDATNVNTSILGSYTIFYNVQDANSNSATTATRTVKVVDTTKPTITLVGADPQVIEVGSAYTELTATANDNYDGDISGDIVIDATNVNTALVGNYTVTYNVADANSNSATSVTRTVNIVDTTKPVITLTGDNPQVIEVHSAYTELTATANDNYDGDISGDIVIDASNVDTAIVGSYEVTYNVVDSNTNEAIEVKRIVDVVDTTDPVITLVGDNPQVLEYNEVYLELGATATDNYDDNISLTTTITIDASNAIAGSSSGIGAFGTLGTYTVTYNVTDVNGNVADQVERTVNVVDTTKPILTLIGDNPQIIEIIDGNDAVYVELGATASDEYDTDVDDSDIVINTSALVLDTVGCYPVTYTVTDASGNTRVRTRIVFVLEEGKPWAKDNSYTVNQDSSNNIFNVLGNDSYGTDGANGTHPISLSGTFTDNGGKLDLVGTNVQYTPRAGFSGEDYFSYTITDENGDGSGDAATANVTIKVVLNPAPTAVDDAIIVAENSGITSIDVLANDDFGTDGAHGSEALTVSGMSAEGGTITVNSGQVDYTPLANFTGLDSFTYTIKDSGGDEATATVLITITIDGTDLPVTKPTAMPDAVVISQNSSNNIINVLADNGFGADNFGTEGAIDGGLTMTNGTNLGASDQGGVISINNQTTLTTLDDVILYTPKAGFIGEDSFKYMITDAVGDTSITIVTVTVQEIATPTAVNDAVIVMQDSGVTSINVLANDSFGSDGAAVVNSLSLPLALSTKGGTIAVNGGEVEYTPASGFNGQDTFTYTIKDGSEDVSTATVTVTVSLAGSGNIPTANDDAVSVIQDSADNSISILLDNGSGADDFGSDGPSATHPISLSATFTDNGGKLILNGTIVEYTPRTGFIGTDNFSYTLTDTTGDASTAQVTINVSEVATPTAVADAVTVAENSGATPINVLANDSFGLDGQATVNPLKLPLALSTEGGTIVVNAGEINYTPANNFSGIDTFNYTIEDGSGDESTAIVTVIVEDEVVVSRRPTALPDAVTVSQNSSNNTINVLADNGAGADDFGTEGAIDGGLTMTNGTLTGDSDQGGTISVDNKGTANTLDDVIIYTPKSGFIGEDGFKYTITDATGFTSITIVTVTVEEIDTPTAVDDSIVVIQNSGVTNIDVLENDSFGSDGAHGSESLSIVSLTGTTTKGGTITINAGKIAYTPALNYNGADRFDYTIKDATNDESTASVNITVSLVNSVNVPLAKDDAVSIVSNTVDNIINILADNGSGVDDFGIDGPNTTHPISLSGTFTDIGSKLELDGNTVKFTPKTNFTGIDTFGYTITDANGDSSTAIVTVNIASLKSTLEANNSLEEVLQVYPNPSKGDFNLSIFTQKSDQVSILLFDVTGKVVHKEKRELSTGKNVIDLSIRAKAGIMFLKVYSDDSNYGTKKIVFK